MNIKFKIGKFLECLDVVDLTVDKRGNLDTKDILLAAGIKDGKSTLYMYSTDFMNQGVTKMSGADITVIEEGSLPFNPKQLYMALSKRDPEAEATIITKNGKTSVKVGRSNLPLETTGSQTLMARLQAIPFNDDPLIEIEPDTLIDLFRRSKVCVSTDTNNTNRYMMRGVHIKSAGNSYIIETTDGFSGSSINVLTEGNLPAFDLVIPGEFIPILISFANKAKKSKTNIKLIKNNYLYFKFDDVIISTSIMVGKFPDVTKMVSSTVPETIVELDHTSLKAAIGRVLGFESFSTKSTGKLIFQANSNTLVIKATSVSDCEEFVDFDNDNNSQIPELKFNLPGQKMLDIINTSSLGTVRLGIPATGNAPIYMEEVIPEKLTARYLIMATR